MADEYNWKLISLTGIPSGLIAAWVFSLKFIPIVKYLFLIVIMGIAAAITYNLAKKDKKAHIFNTLAIILAVVAIVKLVRGLF